jgi:hypothetical protein
MSANNLFILYICLRTGSYLDIGSGAFFCSFFYTVRNASTRSYYIEHLPVVSPGVIV